MTTADERYNGQFQNGDHYRSSIVFDDRPIYIIRHRHAHWVWLQKIGDHRGDWPGVVINVFEEGRLWERMKTEIGGGWVLADSTETA